MWLCGPVAGFIVQPCVGLWSDRSHSRFGRRRPFILVGCLLICFSVIAVGYSSDIGYSLGDTKEDCSVYRGPRWRAAIVYVVGFWMLDFSNNAVQGPLRALMADLSGHHGCTAANAIFVSWISLGNILGYSSGASGEWHKWFPFLMSRACCEACANLKGAFLVAVVFLLLSLVVTLVVAKETPLTKTSGIGEQEQIRAGIVEIYRSIRTLPPGMPSVLLVTALIWASWFPFFLYNTDWMGREVSHGDPKGSLAQTDAYDRGVRVGAFGWLANSIVAGIVTFLIVPMCRKFTAKSVWVGSNFMVSLIMAAVVVVSVWSRQDAHGRTGADPRVEAIALALFTLLGFPLAILYTLPATYVGELTVTHGGGQGLHLGVLNISVVAPQVIVALTAGPWDSLFGKGNSPAFAVASVMAFVSGFVALFMLPKLPRVNMGSSIAGGH